MKKFISLLCLFTLVFSLSAPMQFASAADEIVNVGDKEIVIGGVTYIADTDADGNVKLAFDKVIFEDESGKPMRDESYMQDMNNSEEKRNSSYRYELYSDINPDRTDLDNHKGVFRHVGVNEGAQLDSFYLFNNEAFRGKSGVATISYDVCYTGDLIPNKEVYNHYYVASGSDSNNLKNIFTGTNDDPNKYTFLCSDNTKKDIFSIEKYRWYNITLMIDVDNDNYTVLIDGVPKIIREPLMKGSSTLKVDSLIRSYAYSRSNDSVLYDNLESYIYYPKYDVTSVKGVDADGTTLIEKASYAKDSKIAIQFNTAMMLSSMEGNVELALKGGKKVKIKTIENADYDTATNTLYLTTEEALKPNAEYEVTLKPLEINANGERVAGIVTVNNLGYNEPIVNEITTDAPKYGVQVNDPVTITADSNVGVTVNMRTEETAVESNLVLALYVNGRLRGIDNVSITAGDTTPSHNLSIYVPADDDSVEDKYELRALLLGTNYEVIDVFDVQIAE